MEIDLEKYILSIRKMVDDTLNTIMPNVYKDTEDTNYIVGFKGRQYIQPGYVYAPYIPKYITVNLNLGKNEN